MTCRKPISCHVLLYTRMDETAPIDSPTGFVPAAISLAYSRDFLGGAGHGSDTASYRRVIRRVWGLARLRDHQLVEADVRRRNGNTGFDPMYGPASGCAAHQGYG